MAIKTTDWKITTSIVKEKNNASSLSPDFYRFPPFSSLKWKKAPNQTLKIISTTDKMVMVTTHGMCVSRRWKVR